MPSAETPMVQNPNGPVVEFAWSTLSAALSWIGATVLGLTAGTIVVTSLAYFKGHYNDVQRKNSSERLHFQLCYTKSCQHAAEALATTLSFNVNPCHDFFAFVCDRYNEHIPDAFTGGRNSILSYAIALLFVPPAAEGRQLSSIEKAATLFRSCMRLFSSNNQDFRYVLSNMMDDMHVSLDLPPATFDPFESIVRLGLEYNIPVFVSIAVGNNLDRRKGRTMQISHSSKELEWYAKRKKNRRQARKVYHECYKAYFKGTYDQTSLGIKAGVFARYIDQAEEDASNIAWNVPLRDSDRPSYQETTVGQLPEDWPVVLINLGKQYVHEKDVVFVDPKATTFIKSLRNRFDDIEMKILIAWVLLREYGVYVSPSILATLSPSRSPRDLCSARVSEVMPVAFSASYLSKVITEDAIQAAEGIVLNVRDAYIASLINTSSLDDEPKAAAIAKLKAMEFYSAYPKGLIDVQQLDAYYEGYTPEEREPFFDAWLRGAKALQVKKMSAINTGAVFPVYESKVFYVVHSNRLVALAPALRPTLFIRDGPASFNYGGLGALAGREIMYGYDLNGSTYDAFGNKHNWWSPPARDHYLKQAQCVRLSADTLTEGSVKLGSEAGDVLLADLVGLQMAARAFQAVAGGKDPVLPTLPFSPMQLFFLAHCYKWCDGHDETDGLRHRERCNVAVTNMAEFADAFNCKLGDRLNPSERCSFF
ncbi:membrane metallo-endopeptidase-like 1 [Ornithodoros turicata]|uniref:membrane metallo-endopeptidase-like 1 n=1 Tax=Ornithodoros turicata TaxID=34597 RepID=UPI003138E588